MAHVAAPRTSSPGSRLTAVLDPRIGAPGPAADDPPTVPMRVPRAAERPPGPVGRWLPASWRAARIDPGRPGALAVVLVGVVAAVIAAVGVWREVPRAEPVADLPVLATTAAAVTPVAAPTSSPAAVPDELVVAVAGKVRRPGLVHVPPGSRVADAVEAAGGVLPGVDLAGVNLARKVSDGEQVAVGVPPAPDAGPAPTTGGGEPGAGGSAPLDLNAATVEQLDALPGVGPVTAQRIVDWRTRNGRFATVDQLREVEGIGERRLGQLRGLVRT